MSIFLAWKVQTVTSGRVWYVLLPEEEWYPCKVWQYLLSLLPKLKGDEVEDIDKLKEEQGKAEWPFPPLLLVHLSLPLLHH